MQDQEQYEIKVIVTCTENYTITAPDYNTAKQIATERIIEAIHGGFVPLEFDYDDVW